MADASPSHEARAPRVVAGDRALVWFGEAIRLWRQRPGVFSLMAVLVLVASLAFDAVPIAGLLASNVVAPLLACGFLYGALAADGGDRPRVAHLAAVFTAPPRAQFAVVAAALAVTLIEAAVAWLVAGVNLLASAPDTSNLSPPLVLVIYAAGIVVSMPVQFVPMAVLFDGEAPASAFASSLRGCFMNPRTMLALALYSYALLMAGLVTMGVGLVLGLPWIAMASYAAWKDIYAVAPRQRPRP